MSFVGYFLMGALAYWAGFLVRSKVLNKESSKHNAKNKNIDLTSTNKSYGLKDPIILKCLAAFFAIMLIISWLIGQFILNHEGIDWAFILVNSVVGTFVFSFGLLPESQRYDLPH